MTVIHLSEDYQMLKTQSKFVWLKRCFFSMLLFIFYWFQQNNFFFQVFEPYRKYRQVKGEFKHIKGSTKKQLQTLDQSPQILSTGHIRRELKETKVIAFLKPEKPRNDPKSYRPIALLSSYYKLVEQIILNRIEDENIKPVRTN